MSVVEKSATLIVKDLRANFCERNGFSADLRDAGKDLPEGTVNVSFESS